VDAGTPHGHDGAAQPQRCRGARSRDTRLEPGARQAPRGCPCPRPSARCCTEPCRTVPSPRSPAAPSGQGSNSAAPPASFRSRRPSARHPTFGELRAALQPRAAAGGSRPAGGAHRAGSAQPSQRRAPAQPPHQAPLRAPRLRAADIPGRLGPSGLAPDAAHPIPARPGPARRGAVRRGAAARPLGARRCAGTARYGTKRIRRFAAKHPTRPYGTTERNKNGHKYL